MRISRFAPLGVLLLGVTSTVVLAQENSNTVTPEPSEDLQQEITQREGKLQELAEKISKLRSARTQKEREQTSLTDAVSILEDRVLQARLELDYTAVSIEEVRLRIRQNEEQLTILNERADRLRDQLAYFVRLFSIVSRTSPLVTLLTKDSFADIMAGQQAVARIQEQITSVLIQTRDLRKAREQRAEELQNRRVELEKLAQLQELQRTSLQADEERKRIALSQTIRESARLASLLSEAEQARREIQQEIFSLRNAGIRLSLKQAEDYARYAGRATGVRPALLLGVLKIESNVGTNVGSGRYPNDVRPDQREAFLRVTKKLGMDPETTPVSAKPTTYQGWGGAMGPGQIMPGTWEHVEEDVTRITGKALPSPFELLDAFVATAVILRNAGAASGSEYEAVNRYFAGPNWQRFTWYGDRVLAVAKEYAGRGL